MSTQLPMVKELSVSLVAEVCGTCASWKRKENDRGAFGTCAKIAEDDTVDAYVDSGTSEVLDFRTRAEFGCTLWSSKNAVEERISEMRVAKG